MRKKGTFSYFKGQYEFYKKKLETFALQGKCSCENQCHCDHQYRCSENCYCNGQQKCC